MASDASPPQKSQQHHVRPDSSSNNTTPAAGNRRMPTPGQSSRRGSADSSTLQEFANVNDSHSQLMTGSVSPSEATATEPPSTSATPAPYGTRSRGRNAPRPNYAEDRDIDVDLEVHQPNAKFAKRSGGAANTPGSGSRTDGEKSNSRKSLIAANGSNPAAVRDGIPGTSSFLAKPDEYPDFCTRKCIEEIVHFGSRR
ncbi:hypothetical protein BJX64DRAFT_293508 [Aspergillus heterothallicus]